MIGKKLYWQHSGNRWEGIVSKEFPHNMYQITDCVKNGETEYDKWLLSGLYLTVQKE